jgi:glycerophosphoryl diester phosphodiesterase
LLHVLVAAPFLAALGIVYFTMLRRYDINYYLKQKPPVFFFAVAIGGVIGVALIAMLLRIATGWFFALPLVIFENVRPASALSQSRERAHGRRWTLVALDRRLGAAMVVLSVVATGIVGILGRMVVPKSTGSLDRLAAAIGITLLMAGVVNLAVSLLSETTFAAILYNPLPPSRQATTTQPRSRSMQILQQSAMGSNSPASACSHGAQWRARRVHHRRGDACQRSPR